MFEFLVRALAVVYATKCATALDGPGAIFARARDAAQTRAPDMWGAMLACPWCVGFWIALVAVALPARLLEPLSLAAVAGLLLEESD